VIISIEESQHSVVMDVDDEMSIPDLESLLNTSVDVDVELIVTAENQS